MTPNDAVKRGASSGVDGKALVRARAVTYVLLSAVVLGGGLVFGGFSRFLFSLPLFLAGIWLALRIERIILDRRPSAARSRSRVRAYRRLNSEQIRRYALSVAGLVTILAIQSVVFWSANERDLATVTLVIGATAAIAGIVSIVAMQARRP